MTLPKKTSFICLIIAFLLGLGVLGYAWNLNKSQELIFGSLKHQEKPTSTPEVITSELDTLNWQTYRNEKFGFEVRYPKELYILENYHKDKNSDFKGTIYFDLWEYHIDSPNISVSIKNIKEDSIDYEKIAESWDTFNRKKYKIKEVLINNKEAAQIELENQILVTFFEKNNLLYSISFLPAAEIDPMVYNGFLLSFNLIN